MRNDLINYLCREYPFLLSETAEDIINKIDAFRHNNNNCKICDRLLTIEEVNNLRHDQFLTVCKEHEKYKNWLNVFLAKKDAGLIK